MDNLPMPELVPIKEPNDTTKDMLAVVPNLAELSEDELGTLYAMLTSVTDREAIALAPVSRRTYHKLKPKLIRYSDAFKDSYKERLRTSLQVASVMAIKRLSDILQKTNDPHAAKILAAEILDRTNGLVAPADTGDGSGKVNQQMIVQISTRREE